MNERTAADTAASAEAQTDAGGTRSNAGVAITVENRNYDEKGLQQLVSASSSLDTGSFENAAPTSASADPAAAVRCVKKAVQDRATGRLIRLIQARYQGRAAYIAIYLEGPGAGQQPDLAAAWVASRDNCSFLSLAFSQI